MAIVIIGCKKASPNQSEPPLDLGFYLLADSMMTTVQAQQIALESLTINDQAVLSINDIVTYQWSDHSLELTNDAFNRFKSTENKIKSVLGLPFVVVVKGEKVYLGNIYPGYSSYRPQDLPYVMVMPFVSFKILRAPDSTVADKRIDSRIYDALVANNKLK